LKLDSKDRRFPTRFRDLLPHYEFGRMFHLDLSLDHEGEIARLIVDLYQEGALSDDEHPRVFRRQWEPPGGAVATEERPKEVSLGLLPGVDSCKHWRRQADTLWQSSAWFSPSRAVIQDDYRRPGPDDRKAVMDPEGAQAPGWLFQDPQLADAVGDWYEEHLGAGRLSVHRIGDRYSLKLRHRGKSINLAHAGEGHQQALPLVVQALHRSAAGAQPFLDIFEQPEVHLHDAVHPSLGDLLLDMRSTGGGTVLVETHSEGLLLRVRRRIAEQRVSADDVAIYFVDLGPSGAELRRIPLDSQGEVAWWPRGVFSETYEEVKAIRLAQRDRNGA